MAKVLQNVVFNVGRELYAIGIEAVHEIVNVPEVTAIPDSPPFLEGVINLRGKIVPVIDLRKRLKLIGIERTKSTRVLITENSEHTVGLLVDSVSEVLKIPSETVEEPPAMVSAIGIEYITGVAKVSDRIIILLDLKKVLNIEEMKKLTNNIAGNTDKLVEQLAA